MRVNYERDVKHSGTLDAAGRRKMTIDENSLQHLMSLLTDIYSDPDFAVIREYALNALDSHKSASNDDPIIIELPNDMRPTYIVRDEGTGMSVDEVLNHLSKYGASTKRDTDEETGMLGIGFKAALTYTSQFTCTVVKDGVKAVVLVARDDDGVGSIQIVDTLGTDEPNGVEVQVPVSNMRTFNQKARWFFRFWENGSVLVNGEVPEPILGEWLDDGVVLVESTSYYSEEDWSGTKFASEYVVMGNIPYPVDRSHQLCPLSGKRAIIWVPMGAVNFAPSREALTYTNLTKQTLNDAAWWIKNHLIRIAQDEVNACTNYGEAFRCARKWWLTGDTTARGISFKELTYQHQTIPEYVRIPGGFRWNVHDNRAESFDSTRTVKFSDMVGVYHWGDKLSKVVHVVNHPNRTWAGINRKKFHEYCDKNDIDVPTVVWVYPAKMAHLWMKDFDNVTLIDFADISNVEVSRHGGGDTDEVPYRRVYFGESYVDDKKQYAEYRSGFKYNFVDPKSIPATQRVIYFSPTELTQWTSAVTYALDDEDAWYILINKNRWSKFLREDASHAEHIYDALKKAAKEFVDGLSQADLIALNGSNYWGSSPFSVLRQPEEVLDPELREFIEVFGATRKKVLARWSSFDALHRALGAPKEVNLPKIPEVDFKSKHNSLRSQYPLLKEVSPYRLPRMKEAILTYVNATYKERSHNRYLEELQLTQPDEGSDAT